MFITGRGELRYRDMRKLQGVRQANDDDGVEAILGNAGPDAAEVSIEEFEERMGRFDGSSRNNPSAGTSDEATRAWLRG